MEISESVRKGEKELSHFRTGRFYSADNEWYFSVRGANDQGPYTTKVAAENNLKTYLMDHEHFNANKTKLDIDSLKLI